MTYFAIIKKGCFRKAMPKAAISVKPALTYEDCFTWMCGLHAQLSLAITSSADPPVSS